MAEPGRVSSVVKARSFMFTTGTEGSSVECLNCGWKRKPRWRDPQKVFDLSCDHECVGVESYESMMAREDDR